MLYESKVIIAAIQENFGLDISLRTRRREVVDARQAAIVAMRVMGSTTQIAECFNMDHSTIVYTTKHHEERYNTDPRKRLKHFELYCAVYDFVNDLIKKKKFDQFDAILNVREELERQRAKFNDINEVLIDTQLELKEYQNKVKELTKYKIAYMQLRKNLLQ